MTDKVQKIREEVERLKGWNNNVRNSTRHMTLQEEDFNRGKHSSYLEILNFIDSLQEEPVSEELEEASKEWLAPQLDKSYANYGETKMMELTHFDGYAMLDAIEFGAKWQKTNLWKFADGDDLPEIDREVVVFTQNFSDDAGMMRVSIAHRPNPNGFDGKSLASGKVEHYTPKTYDKGGWNIPDVKFWLDTELPFKDE